MTFLLGLLLLGIVLGVIGVAIGARRVKQSALRSNEVVSGTATAAPIAWAGAHTPEALLHRRLRAAVDAARAQGSAGVAGSNEVLQAVERGATEIDERLIAAAALPATHRDAAIAAIEPSVTALENAIAGVRTDGTAQAPELQAAMDDLQGRLDALAAARAEVDQLDTTRVRPAEGETGSTSTG
jgi:hypothetical protein